MVEPTDALEAAIHRAFVALAEGEGYLRGLPGSNSRVRREAFERVCSRFVAARADIEAVLLLRSFRPTLPIEEPRQSTFFNDSAL